MIGGAVVVVLIIGFLAVNSSKKTENSKATTTQAEKDKMMKKDEEAAMMQEKMGIMEMAMNDKDSKKALLTDVRGGSFSGKAFVLRKDNKLSYTASGNLPDPQEGTFYEGWFVKKGTADYISTGKLDKQKDGSYEVSFSSDNLYPDYNFIVITLEKTDDKKPETHILEGTLE